MQSIRHLYTPKTPESPLYCTSGLLTGASSMPIDSDVSRSSLQASRVPDGGIIWLFMGYDRPNNLHRDW
jgi:hypothetical protein